MTLFMKRVERPTRDPRDVYVYGLLTVYCYDDGECYTYRLPALGITPERIDEINRTLWEDPR